jgi:hypothetical protein
MSMARPAITFLIQKGNCFLLNVVRTHQAMVRHSEVPGLILGRHLHEDFKQYRDELIISTKAGENPVRQVIDDSPGAFVLNFKIELPISWLVFRRATRRTVTFHCAFQFSRG